MLVRELLSKVDKFISVQFIIARAVTYDNTTMYHSEYRDTPIRSAEEWLDLNGYTLDYIVMNDAQPPIEWLSGTGNMWYNAFKSGHLESFLIISPDDLALLYSNQEQRDGMIAFVDNKINARRN